MSRHIKTGKDTELDRETHVGTYLRNNLHSRSVLSSISLHSCLACEINCRRIARSSRFIRTEPSALALPCLWQLLNNEWLISLLCKINGAFVGHCGTKGMYMVLGGLAHTHILYLSRHWRAGQAKIPKEAIGSRRINK